MTSRSPRFWATVARAGLVCLSLSAAMLVAMVWVASQSDTGRVTGPISVMMTIFGVSAILGMIALVVADDSKRAARFTCRRVEVAVCRNPHDVSEVAVFLDGQRVEVHLMREVDPQTNPGAYTREEWLRKGEEAISVPGASHAWVRQMAAWYGVSAVGLNEGDC